MNFTTEQQQAITTHNTNLIVTAGAGSGKTRVLVERYLALLEANPNWYLPQVVAITFTEKAAREMRDRVRAAISERLRTATETATREQWQRHANLLDNARIGTIHGLCAQLLRANPAQVPVDPAFEVMDENDANLLLREAVEQTIATLAESDATASTLLITYSINQVREVLLQYASPSAAKQVNDMSKTIPLADPEQLVAQWQAAYAEYSATILDNLRDDPDYIASTTWEPLDGWESIHPDDKLLTVWEHVHDGILHLDEFSDDPKASLEAIKGVIKRNVGSQKNWGGKAILAESKEYLRILKEDVLDTYIKQMPAAIGAFDHNMARLLPFWIEAINSAAETYKTLKDERNVLDFDDLETLTQDLLNQHKEVVARYADQEFQHVMVDEFQDTNAAQRDIVYQLSGFKADKTDQLFVVGDPKQSIYAFRGADVGVFHDVQTKIEKKGGLTLPLSQSFRTHARLVDTFNHLFADMMHISSDEGRAYDVQFDMPMSAFRESEPHHGVPMTLLTLEADQDQRGNKLYTDDYTRWEAYEIAKQIHAMRQAETLVFDKREQAYRPFEFGDAAILLRALTNITLYEDIFKVMDIPYVVTAGRGYYNRQEVWDMLNLLRALHNPHDDLALATVLRSPMFSLSDQALLALRLLRTEDKQVVPLWDAINHDPIPELVPLDVHTPLQFARSILGHLREIAGRVTVESLIVTALELTAYDAILTALPDGDRRRGNLDKLLVKARDSGRYALGDFLRYVQDLTSSKTVREGEATIESEGVVQIMTIHASKGLEFPIVFLAGTGSKPRAVDKDTVIVEPLSGIACRVYDDEQNLADPFAYHQAYAIAEKRDAAERKRLLYVALTRAQDYVFMSGRAGVQGSWLEDISVLRQKLDLSDLIALDAKLEPPQDAFFDTSQAASQMGWDVAHQHIEGDVTGLPLAAEIPHHTDPMLRHLSVTQLENLGSAPYYNPQADGYRYFRQSVLYDAPDPIRPILRDTRSPERVKSRALGNVIHRALQVGAIPSTTAPEQLYEILAAYAWELRITDPALLQEVVEEATILLNHYEKRGAGVALEQADRVLREVPFIHQVGTRILHGQIDVLYRAHDQWYVMDYKTAPVKSDFVQWHAQRYHLQVGAYAEAVAVQVGQVPIAQLYYLHSGELVTVEPDQWRRALATLDDELGRLG